MKKSGLIIYSLVLLLAGALIGGGVAFSYVQRITVGGTHYGTNFLEKSGIITIYDGKKFQLSGRLQVVYVSLLTLTPTNFARKPPSQIRGGIHRARFTFVVNRVLFCAASGLTVPLRKPGHKYSAAGLTDFTERCIK